MRTNGKRGFGWLLSCLLLLAIDAGCEKLPQTPLGTEAVATTTSPVTPTHRRATIVRQPPPVTGAVYRLQAFGDQGGEAQSSLQCFACHSLKPPNLESASGQDLDQFHQGLQFAHGQLTCASCHNARDNYSTLKLADGRAIPFEESITLCAQCHGTQYRDYLHGAHGGMTGYWDLSRGERVRNHCQHCHDPHAPRYPTFQPAAPPQDKFKPVHALEGAHDVH